MSARFCTQCGAPLVRMHVAGEAHERLVCSACARVSYENPAIVVACIAAAPGREASLCCAPLAPLEAIQRAALRALASDSLDERQLALYCMLSDLDSGAVLVVFRSLEPVSPPATLLAPCPAWSGALLELYKDDGERGCWPVRAGVHQAGALRLDEVPAQRAGGA